MEPSKENRPRESASPSPRSEPMSPTLYLVQNGVLLLEDDRTHLSTVVDIFNTVFKVPSKIIVPYYVDPAASLETTTQNVREIISQKISASGSSFAGVVTDFQVSPFFSSLDVWKAIEEGMVGTPYAVDWVKTCRILMTGAAKNSPEIRHATQAGIIDTCIEKPFGLSTLRTALTEAIHKRVS
jgi:hypothetical protein